MGKKLAIRGHSTRGKEVIKLLEMMGGKNNYDSLADNLALCYFIDDEFDICAQYFGYDDYEDGEINIFTLEDFLEKYPYKVGDKVHIYVQNDDIDGRYDMEVTEISSMRWNPARCKIAYKMKNINREFYKEEIKCKVDDSNKPTNKKTDDIKLSDNKCERTHEDVIFDSIIWHLRNSVNNGKQNLSGGECEDYFREVVKKNNESKMSDCKKCGLGFGSVRCFDKDCPHNTPKSYAVGLKDGEVIECGVNKEIVMNENNREVINMAKETITPAPDITANITDKNNCDIECYQCPDGYEFYDENGNLIGNKVMMSPIKPKYPTTYAECKEMLPENVYYGYSRFMTLQKLIICRDVYWKIYGEQMGLDNPWKPDWENETQIKYMITTFNNELKFFSSLHSYVVGRRNHILSFPSEKMRDAFYENFKKEIEQCKDLL